MNIDVHKWKHLFYLKSKDIQCNFGNLNPFISELCINIKQKVFAISAKRNVLKWNMRLFEIHSEQYCTVTEFNTEKKYE